MINGQTFFDKPVKIDFRTNDSFQKIATGQGDNCTTVYLLDRNYYKDYSRMKPINLSKQQALDAHRKAIQQITGNLPQDGDENVTQFFITEKKKPARFFKMNSGRFLMLSYDLATACVTICFYII